MVEEFNAELVGHVPTENDMLPSYHRLEHLANVNFNHPRHLALRTDGIYEFDFSVCRRHDIGERRVAVDVDTEVIPCREELLHHPDDLYLAVDSSDKELEIVPPVVLSVSATPDLFAQRSHHRLEDLVLIDSVQWFMIEALHHVSCRHHRIDLRPDVDELGVLCLLFALLTELEDAVIFCYDERAAESSRSRKPSSTRR